MNEGATSARHMFAPMLLFWMIMGPSLLSFTYLFDQNGAMIHIYCQGLINHD